VRLDLCPHLIHTLPACGAGILHLTDPLAARSASKIRFHCLASV
jgi:hypothetical protein